ncbi:hypothetical protein ACQKL5_13570 [Peribacillus sp. NPDC097675]|uniref:hypothetical protein n=1 Tax=Peribacillus sp. NPDC097675 TaxID=3390618 RepID=UPI003D066911
MEKKLQKWAFYGFLFGLAVSILLVSNKEVTKVEGGSITQTKPVFDYMLSLLRYSISSMFIFLFFGWRMSEGKKDKKEKGYYLQFFLIVFILAIISSFIFEW